MELAGDAGLDIEWVEPNSCRGRLAWPHCPGTLFICSNANHMASKVVLPLFRPLLLVLFSIAGASLKYFVTTHLMYMLSQELGLGTGQDCGFPQNSFSSSQSAAQANSPRAVLPFDASIGLPGGGGGSVRGEKPAQDPWERVPEAAASGKGDWRRGRRADGAIALCEAPARLHRCRTSPRRGRGRAHGVHGDRREGAWCA